MKRGAPLRDRLDARLTPDAESGCLLWTGPLNNQGYGRIKVGGRRGRYRLVHVMAWELENGPVPDGLVLDHVRARGCIHRHCANTAHLEPVTQRENLMRSDAFSAVNARKTHCPAMHRYTRANTRIDRDGKRHCRECNREQSRNRRVPAVLSHGAISTYTNYGCRCELCASAMSAYQADYHRRRKAATAA